MTDTTETPAAAFDLPDDSLYLNSAGSGPRLTAVTEAAIACVAAGAAPWRWSGADWVEPPETLRTMAAATLGTRDDALAFIPSASYGMAIAARNLSPRAGARVLLMAGEYPSNRNVWLRCATEVGAEVVDVRPDEGESWTSALLRRIDERTTLLSITPCFWTDAAPVDLVAIGDRARRVGAALVVDASQTLGAVPFDFEAVGADFVVSAGHKWLLGGNGLGWLWAAPRWREQGQPLEQSWVAREGRERFGVTDDGSLPPYRVGARRFDFGGYLSPVPIAMATAAMRQLQTWRVDNIARRLGALTRYLKMRLRTAGLESWCEGEHLPHFLALSPVGIDAPSLADALAAQGIFTVAREGRLRISPHLHVDEAGLDRLVEALLQAKPK